MRQIPKALVGLFIMAFGMQCRNTDKGEGDRQEYGHSSAVFQPFVAVMERMDKDIAAIQSENDADRDFARIVLLYNKAAISMADIEAQRGRDTTLKKIAKQIIEERGAESIIFEEFLTTGLRGLRTDSFAIESKRSLPAADLDMQSKQGQTDVAFASAMVIHQRRVLRIAMLYLKYGTIARLVETAQNIVTSERIKLLALKRWLSFKIEHS